MAYTTTSSNKRTTYTNSSRGDIPTQIPIYSQQKPSYSHAKEHQIREEQPYYSNEQTSSRQSIGGDNRRAGGVCNIFIFVN